MKRLRLLFAAAGVSLAVMTGGLFATAAGAQPAPAPTPAPLTAHASSMSLAQRGGETAAQQPISCPYVAGEWTIYAAACASRHAYGCGFGNQGVLPYAPSYLSNDCGTRV